MIKPLSYVVSLAICAVLAGCTSISCHYGPPKPTDALPQGLAVGTVLRTNLLLLGHLNESIDDPSVHYLHVVPSNRATNRFVKLRVDIPKGTKFRVVGYRRAFNPLCSAHEWQLVLESPMRFTPNRDMITVDVSIARDYMMVER